MPSVPTAVRDIEAGQGVENLGDLRGYDQLFVLIRLAGRPVGQAWIPLKEGRVDPEMLQSAVAQAINWVFHEPWLRDGLREGAAEPGKQATVAVCTRDRPDELRECLASLLRMPDDGQELLVIDNCSISDEPRRIVAGHPRVRYIREERPGLNTARNRALREAHGEFVAFIDDDARADPFWLRNLLANFDSPLVAAVTGLTMPLKLETAGQEAFERYSPFGRGFRRICFDASWMAPTSAGKIGAGVNMVLRRDIVRQLGGFFAGFDAGTPTHSGGDYDMFTRILAAGYQIVYDPAGLNWHHHRRDEEALRYTIKGYGIGVYASYVHSLFMYGEFGVFKSAWGWFRYQQWPTFLCALRRGDRHTLNLLLAELQGCLRGPFAYLEARRKLRMESQRKNRGTGEPGNREPGNREPGNREPGNQEAETRKQKP
jgi:glycosyltransferase involved in cell wall biosynthesis